jgi:hypothetical protein
MAWPGNAGGFDFPHGGPLIALPAHPPCLLGTVGTPVRPEDDLPLMPRDVFRLPLCGGGQTGFVGDRTATMHGPSPVDLVQDGTSHRIDRETRGRDERLRLRLRTWFAAEEIEDSHQSLGALGANCLG